MGLLLLILRTAGLAGVLLVRVAGLFPFAFDGGVTLRRLRVGAFLLLVSVIPLEIEGPLLWLLVRREMTEASSPSRMGGIKDAVQVHVVDTVIRGALLHHTLIERFLGSSTGGKGKGVEPEKGVADDPEPTVSKGMRL